MPIVSRFGRLTAVVAHGERLVDGGSRSGGLRPIPGVDRKVRRVLLRGCGRANQLHCCATMR